MIILLLQSRACLDAVLSRILAKISNLLYCDIIQYGFDPVLPGNDYDSVAGAWKFMFYLNKPLTRVQMASANMSRDEGC